MASEFRVKNGLIVDGNTNTVSLSGGTISGGTIYSGSTSLYSIFAGVANGAPNINPTQIAFGSSTSGLTGTSRFVYAPTTTESKFEFRNWVGIADYPTIYLLPSGTTASISNYALTSDGPNTYLNAPTGNLLLRTSGGQRVSIADTLVSMSTGLYTYSALTNTISATTLSATSLYLRDDTNVGLFSASYSYPTLTFNTNSSVLTVQFFRNGTGLVLNDSGWSDLTQTSGVRVTGNLSLGAGNTGYKLHVNGDSKFDGGLTAQTISATTITASTIVATNVRTNTLTATTVSGATIQSDSLRDLSSGTTRMVEASSGGTLSASREIITAIVDDSTAISLLTDTNNWTVSGVYTGTTITNTYQGQMYNDAGYFYVAMADNYFIRLIRG